MADNTDALPPLLAQALDNLEGYFSRESVGFEAVQTVRAALAQRQHVPEAWQALYRRAFNEANGLTNYVDDRPELRSAEKRIAKIEEEARALAAAPALTAAPSAQAEPRKAQEPEAWELFRMARENDFGSDECDAPPTAQAEPQAPVLKLARSLTDELMDCVDRLGSEARDVDPRVWDHLRVYMPPTAQAESQAPLTDEQVLAIFREAVDNDTIKLTRDVGPYEVTEPTHAARTLVNAIVAAARGIGKQEGK